jgi:hypothetical protein
MTRSELYELACDLWGDKAAVVQFGDRYVVGRWVKLRQNVGGLVLATSSSGVEVMGEGSSWEEAARAAKLQKV